MQINLIDLVTQTKNGDRGASSKLYQLTFKSSYYPALRITGNESIAAQAVEESYKKAFSSIGSLKNPQSFEAWIKHITAVKSIELLKQKNQLVFDEQPILPSDIIEDGCEFLPKGLERSANAGKAINKIIDSLPVRQRVVTVLHYYNEMPVVHIAKTLNCAENDVKAELYLARNNIKKCIDRMINKETEIYPSANKPLLALILQSAGKQQAVDEALLRTVFASATKGMFDNSIERLVIETVSAPITASVSTESISQVKTPVANKVKQSKKKNFTDILEKLNSLTKKQKITAIICVAVVVVLVVGSFAITKIVSSKKDIGTDIPDTVYEIDEELLSGIEPYNEIYGESLKTLLSESEEHGFIDLAFNVGYYDNNDIPDLMFFGKRVENGVKKDDTISAIIALDGTGAGWTETDTMVELIDIPKDVLWLGEKGGQVIRAEGKTENQEILRYSKIYYVEEEKISAVLEYRKSADADSTEVTEAWVYQDTTMEEPCQLSGWDEFDARESEMFEGYYQIGYGYSIEEFVNSGKTVTEFLRSAKVGYFGAVSNVSSDEETSTVTQAVSTADYKWVESAVLNNSFAIIENYNEKSCLIKMADTGYFGLIDLKGNIVIKPEYGQYFDCCSYGNNDIHFIMQDENYNEYFIDMNTFKVSSQIHGGHGANDDVIPAGLDDIDRYHNGLAAAKKNGKWGYVDKNNNMVIPFEYEQVEDRFIADDCRGFDGTYIPVKKNGKMGIVNKQNQVVVPFEYTVIMHGDDGIFIAQKNGKWGFIGIGVEPKEPNKPVSEEKTPEWETNYLKTINGEGFEYFEFILTDLDKNDIPDMILIMHRGTRGAISALCMNGEYTDSYSDDFAEDEFYFSKDGKIASKSYIYLGIDQNPSLSYRYYVEQYTYQTFENGSFNGTRSVCRETVYTDSSHTEIESVRYYKYDANYNEVEISEREFNEVYKDITTNYTKATASSVEDFKASGKDLSSYYKKYF